MDRCVLLANWLCMLTICLRGTSEHMMNMYWLRIIASVASVLMWVQMFFWLRLFDSMAQYVDLIIETVIDISELLKLLTLLVLMLSSDFYLVQVNRM